MYQESKAFFVFHHLHCCLTTGQSVRTRSHIKKLWVCPSLSLTWILLFLSIWCDCSLKPVWWTVRALVSKSLCHLAHWLWEGPYPASIAQRFKARRVGEDQRERERDMELDGGEALWKISQILLTGRCPHSGDLGTKCTKSAGTRLCGCRGQSATMFVATQSCDGDRVLGSGGREQDVM